MKFRLLVLLTLLYFSPKTNASNYYWVGGTGNWSDYASHWATTSGGQVFHITVPSPDDDVFFDVNSFPSANDTVYVDSTLIYCKDMDWSGATNDPTFTILNDPVTFNLYGSLTLSPDMSWAIDGSIQGNRV